MEPKRIVETTLRVRYAETDAMGVVYHANYFVWFEAGRGDYFRTSGQDYGEWEGQGYYLPVSEAHARFHAPARYADVVTVRTWVEEARSRSVTLGYEVVDKARQKRLVSGWTRHICMDSSGQACRLPAEMQALLEQA
jgi:acyl-CoA thioester hydrolase